MSWCMKNSSCSTLSGADFFSFKKTKTLLYYIFSRRLIWTAGRMVKHTHIFTEWEIILLNIHLIPGTLLVILTGHWTSTCLDFSYTLLSKCELIWPLIVFMSHVRWSLTVWTLGQNWYNIHATCCKDAKFKWGLHVKLRMIYSKMF